MEATQQVGMVSLGRLNRVVRRKHARPRTDVPMYYQTHCLGDGLAAKVFVFWLEAELAERAELFEGSRVDILFNSATGQGRIRKVSKGGWKVGVKGGKYRVQGAYRAAYGLPAGGPTEAQTFVDDDGIFFTLMRGEG